MAHTNPMQSLYTRLASEGVPKKFIHDFILPSWWDDSDAAQSSGYAHALGIIANNLHVDIKTLRDPSLQIECKSTSVPLFKKRADIDPDELRWPLCLSERVASLVSEIMPEKYNPAALPMSAAQIRREIIHVSGEGYVTLRGLLAWIWNLGIPVIYISEFPTKKKMDGIVLSTPSGRPCILVSKNTPFRAILIFIVSHELGHVAKKHLECNAGLVEINIQRGQSNATESQENEANQFAVELLTGSPQANYRMEGQLNPKRLAEMAIDIGNRDGVDPGVILMNYAWNCGTWKYAMGAMKKLDSVQEGRSDIQKATVDELHLEHLSNDDREFIERIAAPQAEAHSTAGQ